MAKELIPRLPPSPSTYSTNISIIQKQVEKKKMTERAYRLVNDNPTSYPIKKR